MTRLGTCIGAAGVVLGLLALNDEASAECTLALAVENGRPRIGMLVGDHVEIKLKNGPFRKMPFEDVDLDRGDWIMLLPREKRTFTVKTLFDSGTHYKLRYTMRCGSIDEDTGKAVILTLPPAEEDWLTSATVDLGKVSRFCQAATFE